MNSRCVLPAAALALLVSHARAAQWREVRAPTVVPIEALAVSPSASGQLIASLRATPESTYLLGGHGWSFDEGASWERNFGLTTPVLFDIATHPSDPNVMWGAAYSAWKSTDAGRTWSVVLTHSNTISAIAVDPGFPERVYACGPAFAPSGTFHQSHDGGLTWHSSAPVFFSDHSDVAVLAGPQLGIVLITSGSGIYRSTNGGESFVSAMSGQTGVKLATAARNPLVAWCIATNSGGKTRLWRSINSGLTWAKVTTPANDMNDVLAHPTDPARAWVVTTKSGVLYTQNGGLTWLAGTGLGPMVNLQSISLSPSNAAALFAGDQGAHGGVWRSFDSGVSWEHASAGLKTGIPQLRFDGAGGIYAAGLGVPLRLDTPNEPWETLEYAFGHVSTAASLSVHPDDPATLAWVAELPKWKQFNRVIVSRDGGATWTDTTPANAANGIYEVLEVAFGVDGTLYAGAQFGDLYTSADLGASWTPIQPQPPWSRLRELVTDPLEANRLFATDDLNFFRSLDRGQTWERRPIGTESARNPLDLTVSPGHPNVLFVLAGLTEKRLYRSADSGDSWTPLDNGLPRTGLTRFAIDPSNPDRALVGTEREGAYLSRDGGASFVPWSDGIEDLYVLSVAFDPVQAGRAWLSSAQGGLFVRDLP